MFQGTVEHAHDERIHIFGSIHDEGPSSCSTRVKVLGMDLQMFSRYGPQRAVSVNLAVASSTGGALNLFFLLFT